MRNNLYLAVGIIAVLMASTFMYFSEAAVRVTRNTAALGLSQFHATTQIMVTSSLQSARTLTTFLPVDFGISGTGNQGSGANNGIFPITGTLSNFYAYVSAAPGGTASWTVTVYENSSATAITCTIGSSATSCSDISDVVTVAAGDVLSITFTQNNSPNAAHLYATSHFTPATSNQTAFLFASNANISTSGEHYISFSGVLDPSFPSASTTIVLPETGVFSNFYAQLGHALASGSYDIYLNNATQNATTTLTCNLPGLTICSDVAHTYSGAAVDDGLNMAVVPNSPSQSTLIGGGIEFVPTAAGDFDFVNGWNSLSNSIADYIPLAGWGGSVLTVESNAQQYVDAMIITRMSVSIAIAPGGVKSRTFTLNDNGIATPAGCTISGGSQTTCTWTGSVFLNQGDLVDTAATISGTPAATPGSIGYVANASPLQPFIINHSSVTRKTIVNASFTPPNLSSGLQAWWTFDGKNIIDNIADSSGQGNTGTLANFTSTTTATGIAGQALSLNPSGVTNQQVAIAGPSIGTTATLSFWVYPTGVRTSQALIADSGTNNAIYLHNSGTQNLDFFYSAAHHDSAGAAPLNRWTNVVVVDNAGSVTYYINGTADANTFSSGQAFTPASLGNDASSNAFSGKLDDIRVWNRVLSAAEILQLYKLGM